jgi:hypothetical protein
VDGPALKYRDGWAVYCVGGVQVPGEIIEKPETLTVQRIDSEQNAEVRRVMVDLYGRERYLKDAGAELLDEGRDPSGNPGRLWQRKWHDGRSILSVELTNATPEPDGSRRTFFIGVHPECRRLRKRGDGVVEVFGGSQDLTFRNALASTYGKLGSEYVPAVET